MLRRIRVNPPCAFKYIPVETFYEICKLLTIHDLQALSTSCKHFQKLILRMPFPHPVLFPLTKQIYPEIQLKLTKTLIINQMPYSYEWVDQVLGHFKNATTLEIVNEVKSYARIVKLLRSANKANISRILVDKKAVDRWKNVTKNLKLSHLDIRALQNHFRKKRSEYLKINQIKEAFKVQDSPTVLNGDISVQVVNEFNWMRRRAVSCYNAGQKVPGIGYALALNSILLVAPDSHVTYSRPINELKQFNEEARAKYLLYRNSDVFAADINVLVSKFTKAMFGGMDKVETLLMTYKERSKGEEGANFFHNMLHNISQKINVGTDVKGMSEDTFIMTILDPILYAYLDNTMDHIIHHGNDYASPESQQRKVNQAVHYNYLDSNIHGRRPDRSGEVNVRHKHTVYICEAKTEAECRGRPDLAKLGSLMKDALDSALMCGCPKAYSTVGLLCEGRMVTIYVMDLVLDGIYRMIEVDYLFLPMGMRDLATLSTIVEPLLNCRALVNQNKELVLQCHGSPMVDASFIRPTCKSPPHYTDLYES